MSAVDVEVARHIVEKYNFESDIVSFKKLFLIRCILGKLHSKVCILVTHQIQFLKYATKIIFLDKVFSFLLFSNDLYIIIVVVRVFKLQQELTQNYYELVQNLHNGQKQRLVDYVQAQVLRIHHRVN
mgnify:CR=1 FL=1